MPARRDLLPRSEASAEAQVAALADDIAYVNHDIDDALRAGLLTLDDLAQAPLAAPVVAEFVRRTGTAADRAPHTTRCHDG